MRTLADELDSHLERLVTLGFSPRTIRQARYVVSAFLRWLCLSAGVGRADQLRRAHLSRWRTDLGRRHTSRGRPLKPRSVNKHVECVRGFLRYLCAEGLSPAGFVDAVQPVKEPHVLPGGVLSHEQVRCILDRIPSGTASGVRDRAMLEMLYSAGIRAAELLGLDVDRVDFRNGTALVTGKGNRQRVVPVGRTAMRLLESYVRAVRPYMLADRDEQALFLDGAGKRLAYHSLRRIVHRRAEAAGIEINVTPHTFRRSCATEMLRSGANMYHVKELLGHESLETLKHYAKLTITDLKKTHARCHPREREREARP